VNGFQTGPSPTGADWFSIDTVKYRALYSAAFDHACKVDPADLSTDQKDAIRLRVRAMCFDLKNDRWPDDVAAYVRGFVG
jgi:hypothetical protein